MRKSGKILVALALVVLAALLAKNALLKAFAVQQIRKSTGFDLEVKDLKAGLFTHFVDIEGLKLRNPPDFPEREAFDIDRIYVRYDLPSFLTSTVRLDEVIIRIPQVVMVKKETGESNLDRMKQNAEKAKVETQPKETSKPAPPGPRPGEPPPAPEPKVARKEKGFFIRKLTVQLDKVEIRDYSKMRDGKPKISTYNVKQDRTFENVTSVDNLVYQVINEVLIQEALKSVGEQLEKSSKNGKLGDAFKNIGKNLGELFKNPTGKHD